MKKAALFFLMLISCASNLLRAQTFNLINGRDPVASLDGLWRFHTGDNPAWADPHFDDSQWALLRSNESWAKQGHPGYGGYAWYRFQIVVPPGENDLSLFLPPILTSYQVFVQGKMVKTVGPMPPDGTGVMPLRTIIRLPNAASPEARPISIARECGTGRAGQTTTVGARRAAAAWWGNPNCSSRKPGSMETRDCWRAAATIRLHWSRASPGCWVCFCF
ncbi:MAG: hypothetical protein WCE63_19435 [Acidobacteriaceae bacterium]